MVHVYTISPCLLAITSLVTLLLCCAATKHSVTHGHSMSVDSTSGTINNLPADGALDPSAFFEEEDEDIEDEVDAVAAAGGNRRFSRCGSSNSLKDMATGGIPGAAVQSSASSFTAGSRPGAIGLATVSVPLYSASDAATGQVGSYTLTNQHASSTTVSPRAAAAATGHAGSLIDLSEHSPSSIPAAQAAGASMTSPRQTQLMSKPTLASALSPRQGSGLDPSRGSQSPASGIRGHSFTGGAQLGSILNGLSSSSRAAATAGSPHQQQQHSFSLRTALASITPGPLPQPPAPRSSLRGSTHPSAMAAAPAPTATAEVVPPTAPPSYTAAVNCYPAAPGFSSSSQHHVSQQPAGTSYPLPVPNTRHAATGDTLDSLAEGFGGKASKVSGSAYDSPMSTGSNLIGVGDENAVAMDDWDPFAELVNERVSSGGVAAASKTGSGSATGPKDSWTDGFSALAGTRSGGFPSASGHTAPAAFGSVQSVSDVGLLHEHLRNQNSVSPGSPIMVGQRSSLPGIGGNARLQNGAGDGMHEGGVDLLNAGQNWANVVWATSNVVESTTHNQQLPLHRQPSLLDL